MSLVDPYVTLFGKFKSHTISINQNQEENWTPANERVFGNKQEERGTERLDLRSLMHFNNSR